MDTRQFLASLSPETLLQDEVKAKDHELNNPNIFVGFDSSRYVRTIGKIKSGGFSACMILCLAGFAADC
jgi:hypothetical protein